MLSRVCVYVQVKDNGLLCHQAVEQLNPLLNAEATAAQAPGALQWLYNNGADMLEKPSMWIIVSAGRRSSGVRIQDVRMWQTKAARPGMSGTVN